MIHVDDFPALGAEVEAAAAFQSQIARLIDEREELSQRFDAQADAIEQALEASEVPASGQIGLEELTRRLTEIEREAGAFLSRTLSMLAEPESDLPVQLRTNKRSA